MNVMSLDWWETLKTRKIIEKGGTKCTSSYAPLVFAVTPSIGWPSAPFIDFRNICRWSPLLPAAGSER